MNIFFVDEDPVLAAQALCDKHVVKMMLESTQLLCTAVKHSNHTSSWMLFNQLLVKNSLPLYKKTHSNHPCSVWIRRAKQNFRWLLKHANALSWEYTYRYGKVHKCAQYIGLMEEAEVFEGFHKYCTCDECLVLLNTKEVLTPPRCMPSDYKYPVIENEDSLELRKKKVVTSYRSYYIGEKKSFAKWDRTRPPPSWWPEHLQ